MCRVGGVTMPPGPCGRLGSDLRSLSGGQASCFHVAEMLPLDDFWQYQSRAEESTKKSPALPVVGCEPAVLGNIWRAAAPPLSRAPRPSLPPTPTTPKPAPVVPRCSPHTPMPRAPSLTPVMVPLMFVPLVDST